MAEGFNIKTIKLEGQLSKYTNVMRGYQFRYFVVNSELFRLDYFMSEDMKHQKPRGSIELKKAVMSPSDEDSTTFTIHSFENEIFKLRAQDAKERQHWVNVLRYVVHSKGGENEIQIPVLLNRSNTSSSSSCNNNYYQNSNINETLNEASLSLDNNSKVIANEKISNLDLIREILNQVKSNHFKFEQLIEGLPVKKGSISKYNKDILILKATGRSCVACITDCCNILKSNQKMKISNFIPSESHKTKKSNKNSFQTNDTYPRLLPVPSLNNSNNNNNAIQSKKLFYISSNSLNDLTTDAELTDTEDILAEPLNDNNSEEHKNQILQVLPELKIGMDLTKVELPLFLFEKRSLLELFADCLLSHPDLFIKIDNIETTAEDRFLAVLDWYLTSFHKISKINKKPYNPMLGEKFQCSFKVKTDQSDHLTVVNFLAEQVSHHPSVTAIYIECKEKRLKLNGSIRIKSEYLGMSISVQFVGDLILKSDKYNEEYKITLPTYFTRSIVTKPWSELGGICSINCVSSGCSATLEFILKSFYGEKSNQISVLVKNKNNDVICKITGEWNARLEYEYYLNNNSKKTVIDTNQLKKYKKRVRAIDKQDPNESRRLWYHVSIALHKADFHLAYVNKNLIEKQFSQQEQNEFVSKYFKKITAAENSVAGESDQIVWINKNF